MIEYSRNAIISAGYLPYYMYRQKYMIGNFENVGYCLKGCQCKYNIDMMEETANIFACGANAISKRVFHHHAQSTLWQNTSKSSDGSPAIKSMFI